MRKYSRLVTVQEKKHRRQAVMWIFLSIVLIGVLGMWGFPAFAQITTFVTDLRKKETVSKDDTIAPAPPILTSSDATTNNPSFLLSGTAESKSTIILSHNGQGGEIPVDENGSFEKIVTLLEGENNFSATSRDSVGNESAPSQQLTVNYDAKPPEIEITQPSDRQEFAGNQQQNLTIKGSTNEEAAVTINGRISSSLQDNEFSLQIKLQEGSNELAIIATDTAGNTTEQKLTVYFYR